MLLKEDLIVIEPDAAKNQFTKLISQIKHCEDIEVKKSLLALLNIYLFQTLDCVKQQNKDCSISQEDWDEYSAFYEEESKSKDLEESYSDDPFDLADWPK